ncbi:MAG: hypothetical protein ACT4PT_12925 [Methanobacteriota archaeon]
MNRAAAVLFVVELATVPSAQAGGGGPGHAHGGDFGSPLLSPNETWALVLDEAGTYEYRCHPHPWMEGRLVVAEDARAAANVTVRIANYTFEPAEVRIRPGAEVLFVNEDHDNHTVTQTTAAAEDEGSAESPSGSVAAFLAVVVVALAARLRRRQLL